MSDHPPLSGSCPHIDEILRHAVSVKASDVHINVGLPPMLRVNTVVQPAPFPVLTADACMTLLKQVMEEKRWPGFETLRDSDFSYETFTCPRW
jgi:twitching motility protein PilT